MSLKTRAKFGTGFDVRNYVQCVARPGSTAKWCYLDLESGIYCILHMAHIPDKIRPKRGPELQPCSQMQCNAASHRLVEICGGEKVGWDGMGWGRESLRFWALDRVSRQPSNQIGWSIELPSPAQHRSNFNGQTPRATVASS